jgi:hypothetical protein
MITLGASDGEIIFRLSAEAPMKRLLIFVSLFLSLVVPAASALDLSTRVVSPVRNWREADLKRFSDKWVHVKFVEGSNVVLQGDRFDDDTGLDLTSVNATLAGNKILQIRQTFDYDRATARGWKALGEARSGEVGSDLSLWYSIRVEGGAVAVAKLINDLNASPSVEIAHPEPIVENASIDNPKATLPQPMQAVTPTPDFTGLQGYLYNPPVGLNAPAAWNYPGGSGAGGRFIDVELAWTVDHEDFPLARLFYVGGVAQDPQYEYHGTAVLGEVIGQQNGFGVDGFAHGLDGYGVVAIALQEWPVVPAYFQEAVDQLSSGDVWLIELQMFPPGRDATPMEWVQVNYDVIWTSVWSRNIICIEAGANGTQNLDDPSWGGVFDRNVRDSGAIMVAAGTPNGLVAEWFTNWGSRMDVHAWGSAIITTGVGDLYNGGSLQTRYTNTFGGTSGASPMVAGSALCLGGIARAASIAFTPIDIRTILHDTGTPHQGSSYIGPRPNLENAAAELLNTVSVALPDHQAAPWAIESFPNPFTESVQLRFAGPGSGAMRVSVFDAAGRKVSELKDMLVGGESQAFTWNGRSDAGIPLGSGVYFFRIESPGFERRIKVQKIR